MCDIFAKDLYPFRINIQRGNKSYKRKYRNTITHHSTFCGRIASLLLLTIIAWFLSVKIKLMVANQPTSYYTVVSQLS